MSNFTSIIMESLSDLINNESIKKIISVNPINNLKIQIFTNYPSIKKYIEKNYHIYTPGIIKKRKIELYIIKTHYNWSKKFSFIKSICNQDKWNYMFYINDLKFIVNKEFDICQCIDNDFIMMFGEDINLFYILATINRIVSTIVIDDGIIPFHGGALEKDEKGILLLGESESGKSSITFGLLSKGYKFISEDTSFINFNDNKILITGLDDSINKDIRIKKESVSTLVNINPNLKFKLTYKLKENKYYFKNENLFDENFTTWANLKIIILLTNNNDNQTLIVNDLNEKKIILQKGLRDFGLFTFVEDTYRKTIANLLMHEAKIISQCIFIKIGKYKNFNERLVIIKNLIS